VSLAGLVVLASLTAGVHGWLRWVPGLAGVATFVFFNLRCCEAGEYLSKAKGIYHPMYGSLGWSGLLMAVFARSPRKP
jgi:hypothetical protein